MTWLAPSSYSAWQQSVTTIMQLLHGALQAHFPRHLLTAHHHLLQNTNGECGPMQSSFLWSVCVCACPKHPNRWKTTALFFPWLVSLYLFIVMSWFYFYGLRGMEKTSWLWRWYHFDTFSSRFTDPFLVIGVTAVFLHVRCIPQQNSY